MYLFLLMYRSIKFLKSLTCEVESIMLPIDPKATLFEGSLLLVYVCHQLSDVIPQKIMKKISLFRSDHNLHIFSNYSFNFSKPSKRLQAVRVVASGGKFYRLPPDKENTMAYYIYLIATWSFIHLNLTYPLCSWQWLEDTQIWHFVLEGLGHL